MNNIRYILEIKEKGIWESSSAEQGKRESHSPNGKATDRMKTCKIWKGSLLPKFIRDFKKSEAICKTWHYNEREE